jgi:hypothetical protein
MRIVRSIVLMASITALASCNQDTCNTKPAELRTPTGGCQATPLRGGATVTIQGSPACQQCSDSNPTCRVEITNGNIIELNTTFTECDSAKGCDGSRGCAFGQGTLITCTVNLPATNATNWRIQAPISPGTLAQIPITIDPAGATSCTL